MADLKIYNNGENKILFSAGDRIIRQPYDFSRGFKPDNKMKTFISIAGLSLQYKYSYLFILSNPFVSESPIASIGDGVVSENVWRAGAGFSTSTIETPNNRVSVNVGGWPSILYRKYDNGISSIMNGLGGEAVVDRSLTVNNGVRDRAVIGASAGSNVNVFPASPSQMYFGVFHRVVFFDRFLDISEIRYLYNNGTFSDFQTSEGIVHDYVLNSAEILNNGSGDFVGVRDFKGGNHGEIMNLPAGTLQEQLDWANANLFVPFIS